MRSPEIGIRDGAPVHGGKGTPLRLHDRLCQGCHRAGNVTGWQGKDIPRGLPPSNLKVKRNKNFASGRQSITKGHAEQREMTSSLTRGWRRREPDLS